MQKFSCLAGRFEGKDGFLLFSAFPLALVHVPSRMKRLVNLPASLARAAADRIFRDMRAALGLQHRFVVRRIDAVFRVPSWVTNPPHRRKIPLIP